MSSDYEKKLKEIRVSEGLTQAEFADITGVNIGTIKNYESGNREVGLSVVDRVIKSRDFEKYTIWLMTGKTNEAAGQISPSLSPDGQERTSPSQTSRKTGTRRG
ncbi:helix-turn-helix domain-containing protein [Salmonella enterica]|uniref:XRE family transcriptional regulator n=2 Tax=Salmonella enterica TaxID=28901 RepID=A0A402SRA7_SALER|nr:helix-turn-helix transcriptional regulator [Salmonella enterica]EBP3922118.1 helix-turn-helix transcriptional regulator [Salmonella enterica subsp. enterica]EBV7384128.1 XRE family transcriptional regulator [Salmonella enterica subsp. enterica serovar Hadar]ECS7499765.1 XRE family transcriptional regulator [Salmonella enterica subsp. enterica serovar Newport]EDJ3056037.1 transcriptional regulator [Salmonella enterica subsp. enterica serovar Muenchen]EDO5379244.1 helix-turn-helix domain-cont